MDVTHDWKTLNEVFFANSNIRSGENGLASSLVLIEDGGRIIDGAVSTGAPFKDHCEFDKNKLDALAAKYNIEKIAVLPKTKMNQLVDEASSLGTNYFQQLELLRTRILEDLGSMVVTQRHFLLDLFSSNFRKLLPKRFNLLVFLDHRPAYSNQAEAQYQAVLLSYSDGKLDQFFEPDFSSLHENRLRDWKVESEAVGQYLENRYLLPCFGVFVSKADWDACTSQEGAEPKAWTFFNQLMHENRAAIYPRKNFSMKAMLATHRIMGYFGRA